MGKVRGEGIWVIDVSTGQKQRLSQGANDQVAQWSPGGGRVLFYGLREGDYELMLAHLAAATVERLTDNRRNDLFPRWDASGSSVVYTSSSPSGARHLFRLALSDGALTRLTPRKTHDEGGIVSPDGTQIAYGEGIWVMDSNGSQKTELFTGEVDRGSLVWSPGGNRLAFSHLNNHRYDISVVDVKSGQVSALTRLRGDESVSDWR